MNNDRQGKPGSPLNDILNRLAGLGPGLHIVVVIKGKTGGDGILTWAVIQAALEPRGVLLVREEQGAEAVPAE
jgi:hypothetical protein